MKLLKYLLILFLVIIAIPLVLALFVEKDYELEREVVIDVSNERVFNYIRFLKNHDDFSVWAQRDTLIKNSYVGTDGTVGFVYKWDSNNSNVGTGEQEIIAIQDGKRIDYELRFKEPMASRSTAYMHTDSLGVDKTRLVWGICRAYELSNECVASVCRYGVHVGRGSSTRLRYFKEAT